MTYPAYEKYKESDVPWLGQVPKGWEVTRLNEAAGILTSNVDKKSEENEISVKLCNYVDVYYNEKVNSNIEFMQATATLAEINKFRLCKGDVVITKDSESPSDIGIPALIAEDIDDLVCGYHLAILKEVPKKTWGAFLHYIIKSCPSAAQFEVLANGITRFGLSRDDLKNLRFALPSIPEQKAIAEFLDKKTAEIDALIAKKEELLKLLAEQRTALITHAVTKGLNSSAPMKDSGIDWLGHIPQHWECVKIKWLTAVKRGASPRPIDDPKYFDDDGEYAWVRIADVSASERYLEETTQRLSDLGSSLSVKMRPDSIFLSIAGSVGKPIITKIKCCIHDGFVYFPELKENSEFLYYLFSSGQPYLGLGKLGTQLNLNTDTVGGITIGLPPKEEQQEIVDYLDTETGRLTAIANKAQEAIDRLKEYRTALITNAVTGKIDVRGYQHGQEAA